MKNKKRKKKRKKVKQIKNKKQKEKIILIPIIFSIVILIILAILIINIPLNPKYGIHTTDTTTYFKWIGFATNAYVDDNPEFTSPIIVEKDEFLELKPGDYYWKTEMLSPINKFTIDSEVTITIEDGEKDETKKVRNVGNIEILLEIFKNFVLTGRTVLNLNETLDINVSNNTKIIASQYNAETN